MGAGNQFSSLRSVAEGLAKGEELIICVPDGESGRLIAQCLRSSGHWKSPSEAPFKARTVQAAIVALRAELRAFSPRHIIVLNLSSPGEGALCKESNLLDFHERVVKILRGRTMRSVWIVSRTMLSSKSLGILKDKPALFADCRIEGAFSLCQFITAKGAYGPEIFEPRRVDLNTPELPLHPLSLDVDGLQGPYREAFVGAHEGILLINLKSGILEANPRAQEMLGHPSTEYGTLTLGRVVSPSEYRRSLRLLSSLKNRRKSSGIVALRRKSGRVFNAAFSASALAGGKAVIIFRDVTDEIERAEKLRQSQDEFRRIADGAPNPNALFGARRMLFSNAAFRMLFPAAGGGSEEPTIKSVFGSANAHFARRVSDLTRPDSAGSPPESEEADLALPNGERRTFALRFVETSWEGNPALHLILTDVTERNSALRALRESDRSFREVCERQGGALSIIQDANLAFVNAAYAAMFGFATTHELIGKDALATVLPRERKAVSALIDQLAGSEGAPAAVDYIGVRPDGAHLSISAQCVRIEYLGHPAVLCHHVDVSKQRAAELELRKGMRRESIIEKFAHELHHSLSPADVMSGGLKAAMQWSGFEQGGVYAPSSDAGTFELICNEALPASVSSSLAVQNSGEGLAGLVCKTAEPLLLNVADYPAYLPHRSLFESEGIRAVLFLPFVSAEHVHAIIMMCSAKEAAGPALDSDLLAMLSRHAGEALSNALRFESIQKAERMFHTAVESITDVVYQCASSGTFAYVSPQVERLSGHRPDEFLRLPDLWRSLLHPDDRTEYSRRISTQASGTDEFAIEYRLMPKGKASYRWVRDAVRYRRDEAGNVSTIYGLVTDISARVEAERAASAGESFRADVLESVQEGVIVYDKDLRYREWNRAMELITGFTRADVVGRSAFDDGPQFQLAEFEELLHRALAGTPVSSEEVRYARSGSEDIALLWCRFSPLRDRSGAISGVVVTVTDVTHRKSLERELRESEETLRNVIDTMGDALMISDLQGKVWEVNREFTSLTGYARGDVIGMAFPYPWLIEEQMARFLVWLAALRERKFLRDFDMTWRRQRGGDVAISLNTTLLRNALGEPVAMLNIARDITERRRLVTELTNKSKQIEMVNRIISKANSTMEFPRIFEVVAEEIGSLMSFDHMDVALLSEDRRNCVVYATAGSSGGFPATGETFPLEKSVSKLSVETRQAVIVDDIGQEQGLGSAIRSAEAGMRSAISIPILLNEKIIGTFNVDGAAPRAYGAGELSYLQPIADQIGAVIDRTQLFRRVSDDSAYIHNLLNSIESVVITVDRNSIVREVNAAWRDFAVLQGTEQLRDEASVIGRPLEEIIPFPSLRQELASVMT
ncbi:MAG TPA: PAS domain S-box protein, partial [Bacteroidota bacterium]|nr:PAS domain S-box protein [Bacteroidota bacterium]